MNSNVPTVDKNWRDVVDTVKKLDPKTLKIIQSTLPIIAEHGMNITTTFYKRLFEKHPEMKNIFNMTHQRTGHQPKALADAVYAAAVNIENMKEIMPALERIGEKHRSLQIKPEHYPVVGEGLLAAIREVLGDAATDEILNAWADAYQVIADVFIRMENSMYQTAESQVGGWAGFKNFTVDKKVIESDVITSFYLKPKDGASIAQFIPGQYITVKIDIPGHPFTQLRQYSLSDGPGREYYRISVKKEEAPEVSVPSGLVSTYLHDHVQPGDIIPITSPAGDFYLNMESKSPVVLMSGGIGLTPLMAMLNTMMEQQSDRPVTFIQAALNGKVHAFRNYMRDISATHPRLKSFTIYQDPTDEDKAAKSFDKDGFITLEWMKEVLDPHDADFYFCGPTPFMQAVNRALKDWDVPEENRHYEFFGTFAGLE